MKPLLALAACCSSLLFSSCAFGGGTSAFEKAAENAVKAALLTPADLPPGWTAEPQDQDDQTDVEFTGECAFYEEDEFPGSVATADSDELTGPQNQFVSTSAVAFKSEQEAADGLDEFIRLPDVCRRQLEDILTKTMSDSLAKEGIADANVTVSVQDFAFPDQLGSSRGSYRVNFSWVAGGVPFSGSMDFVFWQEGRMIGGFVYMTFGDLNMPEERHVASLIDNKLKFAEPSLPGA